VPTGAAAVPVAAGIAAPLQPFLPLQEVFAPEVAGSLAGFCSPPHATAVPARIPATAAAAIVLEKFMINLLEGVRIGKQSRLSRLTIRADAQSVSIFCTFLGGRRSPDALECPLECPPNRASLVLQSVLVSEEKTPEISESAPTPAANDKPVGNPFQRRGLVPLIVGLASLFLLMAYDARIPCGILLGLCFGLAAVYGALDFFGTFDDALQHQEGRGNDSPLLAPTLLELAPSLVKFLVTIAAFLGLVAAAGKGVPVNAWGLGCLITLAFLFACASGFEIARALGVVKGSVFSRYGFWVLALGAALYFPGLGVFSLSDPWETHYGEVAREILARNDWISLWWAQDGFFWSKPILNFWIQALAMGTLGTGFQADQMLAGAAGPGTAHPEWVVRMPNVLLTLLGMLLLYKGVAKAAGKRAGFIGAFVLATAPDWYFLAHQTMTDMPFVAPMTGAMGLMLMGLNTDADTRVNTYGLRIGNRTLSLSAFHLVFGAIAVCAIPQVVYLLTRNLDLLVHAPVKGFRFHFDEFVSGSAVNCGLPGNEACRTMGPVTSPRNIANPALRLLVGFEPLAQGLVWAAVLGGLLHLNRGERRTQRLYYLAAWFLAAIATMGKGPVGLVLPMAATFVYVLSARRFSEILKFEIWSGVLIVGCVAAPWFVAMYVRHGPPFFERLFMHDMYNRALSHVHDTNEGDDTSLRFYLWQIGYALFPWVGLAPLGLTFWARKGDADRGGAATFLTIWFAVCFGLFSFMGTKFHHYIFPAIPPIAMLIGIALDDALPKVALPSGRALAVALTWATAAALLLVMGVALAFPGPLLGTKPLTGDSPAKLGLAAGVLAAGVLATLGWIRQYAERAEDEPAGAESSHHLRMFSAAVLAGLFALALVGRDLTFKGDSTDQPGAIRFLQLFTYNYKRPWPIEDLDFSPALIALTWVAIALTLAMAIPRIRKQAIVLFCGLSLISATWGTDIYFVKVSPHWGQRDLVEAYYKDRKTADEPLVAYQMNWKGENFYTSNHIPAFVSSGATFTTWLKTQREKGVKVMYFVTEHSRTGGLKSEVAGKSYKEITDKRVCNKFVVVRAEL
jgi:4-amino-4-deoxy-L-arabinose transferase-like glycosyltransferase